MPARPPPLPQRHSLVAQTVQSLRAGIESGHWNEFLPGERELCESLQVSRRTLRSALDEMQHLGWLEVSDRRRRRITNRRVQAKTEAKKRTVAILTPGTFLSLPSPVSYVMDTLRSKLTAAGCVVQFHVNPGCYMAPPGKALARFVAEHPATVWLILSAQAPMQRWFSEQKINCLILGSCAPGVHLPSIDSDYHASCHHAGGLLWRKGHRRIALVMAKGVYGGDMASEEGLREALKDLPDTHLQVIRHNTTTAHLCAQIDQCLRSAHPPTAYLVARAPFTLTVVMHLMRRGKRIPQDVAVISRDDDPLFQATSPSIARYASQPTQLANRIALTVRTLAESGVVVASQIRLMPTFVPGESV